MTTGHFGGSSIEGQNIPQALVPRESSDSYTYSFSPILTKEIYDSIRNPQILSVIVSWGGGLQTTNALAIDSSGKTVSQTSPELTLKITKKTPYSVVVRVFSALNATGKIKINLTTEAYNPS